MQYAYDEAHTSTAIPGAVNADTDYGLGQHIGLNSKSDGNDTTSSYVPVAASPPLNSSSLAATLTSNSSPQTHSGTSSSNSSGLYTPTTPSDSVHQEWDDIFICMIYYSLLAYDILPLIKNIFKFQW